MNDEQPKSLETTIIAWADAFKDITEKPKKHQRHYKVYWTMKLSICITSPYFKKSN